MGDLVMVVRGHPCILESAAGIPFVVTEFDFGSGWYCSRCHYHGPDKSVVKGFWGVSDIPVSYLKRIDPLAEPESITRSEKISA